MTLFLAFQQIHSSTSQCSFAKKAPRMNKKTHTLPRPLWHEACATIHSHIQPYTVFHCNAFRFLKTSRTQDTVFGCVWMCLDVFGVYSLLFFFGVQIHRIWNMQLIQSMVGSTVPQFNHPFGLPLLPVKSHGRHFGLGAKQFLVSFLSAEKCMPN